MARETWVQSQVASCQRLKKWYLMPPCLTLSIIRYGSRVKLSNPGKGVAPSPTPWCSSYRKGSLRVTLDYGRQLYFTYIYIYICVCVITQPLCHVQDVTQSQDFRAGLNVEFSSLDRLPYLAERTQPVPLLICYLSIEGQTGFFCLG